MSIIIVLFGGLHIEMAALKSIGSLLKESGWTGALVEAGLACSGTAESFLTASSITRTRQIHQITACSLYQLLKAAYTDYCKETAKNSEELLSFDAWCEKRKPESPPVSVLAPSAVHGTGDPPPDSIV